MVFLLIVVTVFLGDQLIKCKIEKDFAPGEEKEILDGKVTLTKEYNNGCFLNFMEKRGDIVKAVSAAFLGLSMISLLVSLFKKGKGLKKLGLSFLAGGAFSNVADRFKKGHVVDYLIFDKLKTVVFNVGDLFIFVGGIFLVIHSIIGDFKKS